MVKLRKEAQLLLKDILQQLEELVVRVHFNFVSAVLDQGNKSEENCTEYLSEQP